ncbi:hypothetical protein BRADI_4g05430v3 [Brachypodium distachyon]|uniref:Thaumatin-like protein n=1 Tax=Brachypodium distachyon TaxID=15368 RepID=A0A2K2CKM8_BRADI|nr:hypothetical protein BRADI_4g05430v3 [Brachypodium distachyon]
MPCRGLASIRASFGSDFGVPGLGLGLVEMLWAENKPAMLIAALAAGCAVDAARFTITNKCSYTVWPASIPVGGGVRLDPGRTTTLDVAAGTPAVRIWARTGCTFDASARGSCKTGDCGGKLACTAGGKPPATLAEFTLGSGSGSRDFYDVSLVDGFNVPVSFAPAAGSGCHAISCAADINARCPPELKVDGGCASACLKFNTDRYCCQSGPAKCQPSDYSRFFKGLCPDAYSYAFDDKSSTFTCAAGTNYQITFCP